MQRYQQLIFQWFCRDFDVRFAEFKRHCLNFERFTKVIKVPFRVNRPFSFALNAFKFRFVFKYLDLSIQFFSYFHNL
jgi:hypothetical protein